MRFCNLTHNFQAEAVFFLLVAGLHTANTFICV